ncbi:hypothetical protein [Celerinatantimonas sp. MCCC 1A17872]|uniref:hypothetical protein n=1 Tax=Celerinatantimonas sp. MCCC 1A17872 TaxID=3177514 RepID=UPI0038C6CB0A
MKEPSPEHKQNSPTAIWKIIVYSCLLTASATVLLLLLALQFFSAPSLLKYTGYAHSLVLANPHKYTDPVTIFHLGEMVENGTLLSLDDLWGFQSSFYQTIITLLIALNGIIAAFSFIFIKSSSNEKSIEAAENKVESYVNSVSFRTLIDSSFKKITKNVRDDYNSTAQTLDEKIKIVDELLPIIYSNEENINNLISERQEIRNHISILIKRLSELDNSENDGEYNLEKND